MGPDETPGARIARARASQESLEFDAVVGLLAPLHGRTDLTPALAISAALLETEAFVALHVPTQAIEACRRGVVAAGYDPGLARDSTPGVQSVCRTAADEARAAMVQSRGLRVEDVRIETGPIAWNAIPLRVRFGGDLSSLLTQVEVSVQGAPPVTMNLPPSREGERTATLDRNLATPGARIETVVSVRDAFGVLLRSPATVGSVPRDEAAVRFAAGTDQGALQIDGQPSSRRVEIGTLLPLPVGDHTLEVRTSSGLTSRAQVALHRGEVALLTLRTAPGVRFLDVARWGSSGLAVVAAGTAAVFWALDGEYRARLTQLSDLRDPSSGLPDIRYSEIKSIDQSRVVVQDLALAFTISGVALGGLAVALWAIAPPRESAPRTTAHPSVAVHPAPNGLAVVF